MPYPGEISMDTQTNQHLQKTSCFRSTNSHIFTQRLAKERRKIISIVSDKLKTLPSFSLTDLVRCSTLASPHTGLPLPLQDQRMLSFWTSSNHIHASSELQLAQLPRGSCPLRPAWLVQGWWESLLECEFDRWILLLMSSCVPSEYHLPKVESWGRLRNMRCQ